MYAKYKISCCEHLTIWFIVYSLCSQQRGGECLCNKQQFGDIDHIVHDSASLAFLLLIIITCYAYERKNMHFHVML